MEVLWYDFEYSNKGRREAREKKVLDIFIANISAIESI
jgi:hypothetical protein